MNQFLLGKTKISKACGVKKGNLIGQFFDKQIAHTPLPKHKSKRLLVST